MTTKTIELQDIKQTLGRLQDRVRELTTDLEPAGSGHAPVTESPRGVPGELPAAMHDLLRAGIGELSTLSKLKDFPEFFVRLSRQTGLRMLLLKRWSSGLQVFLDENVKISPDACKKRSDGRAPIPCTKDDIFSALAADGTVYCGPVPQKHFPLDLTLLLGRGTRDRRIVILPLPSQNHWNTFLYLDADGSTEPALAAAEILAHYALARMCLLGKGVLVRQGQVGEILKIELERRRAALARRDGTEAEDIPPSEYGHTLPGTRSLEEIDPFASELPAVEPTGEPVTRPLAPAVARRPAPAADEIQIFGDQDQSDAVRLPAVSVSRSVVAVPGHSLTPELILNHSGELPALPKAACHIMAVIEDPRTTATRLEKALAMDQALTAKVLRIANSPFYGAVRQITTVSESIVRLGFVTIRNWTLVTAARSVFLAPGAGMLYQKIWRQSVLSAMGAQLVAQAMGRVQPEGVFIGGLMQNIGQLVLARSHPELFQEILSESADSGMPYHEVENRVLGFDHGELGALLLKEWNLSEDLEDAVRWHHRFQHPEARNVRVAAMIALGEEIAHCHSGDDQNLADTDGEQTAIVGPSPCAAFLGLSPERVANLVVQAGELKIDPHFFN